jgi:adenosylhomocysteine nucleosidase
VNTPASGKIAIIAALERELRPLTRGWPARVREQAGHRIRIFEGKNCVVICGGIGAEAARRAAEAAIADYQPASIISAGFAGALTPSLKAGGVVIPWQVINVADGSRFDTGAGEGKLLSFTEVANQEQKVKLAKAYDAEAVDMEAAAVARCAQIHGVKFLAVKAISDEANVSLPKIGKFIADARIRMGPFLMFMAVRPWLWPGLFRLARNTAKASRALCQALQPYTGGA